MKGEVPYGSNGEDQKRRYDDGNSLPAFHIPGTEHLVVSLEYMENESFMNTSQQIVARWSKDDSKHSVGCTYGELFLTHSSDGVSIISEKRCFRG